MAVSVTFPSGFVAGSVHAGIKEPGRPDLSFVGFSDGERHASAAVFTRSQAAAAPVLVSRSNLAASLGEVRGVVLSSGNANALTGERGVQDARMMTAKVAKSFGGLASEYLICQTGLIGIYLPVEAIMTGIEALPGSVGASESAARSAAEGIMTTDTFAKMATRDLGGVRIGGMAKGAAMIAPNMATMLSVITTDASLSPERAQAALASAVDQSFNRITIDGCTSTNDTVVLLSSGLAGEPGGEFEESLTDLSLELARMIVTDAEGGSKVITVRVIEALDEEEALACARQVAGSLLVKCSFLGEDPYWGRVVAEVGVSSGDIDVSRVSVSYQGITVCTQGVDALERLSVHERDLLRSRMSEKDILLEICLGRGGRSAEVLTADIGPGYLEENRGTS